MPSKRKLTPGPKLTRSKTVTIRLDPKTHYLAELASRAQRRTLSSYIEWAITESLRQVFLPETSLPDSSIRGNAQVLWSVNEAERLVTLALTSPALLTYDEQLIWSAINDELAHERPGGREWDDMALDWVKANWESIKQYAAGEIDLTAFHNSIEVPF